MILVRLPPNVVVVAPTSLERRGSNNHDAGLLFGGPQPRQLEAPGLVAPGLVALYLVAPGVVAPGVVAPASLRAASSRPRHALRRRALPRRVPPRRAPPRRAGVVAPASTSSRRTSSRPASSRRRRRAGVYLVASYLVVLCLWARLQRLTHRRGPLRDGTRPSFATLARQSRRLSPAGSAQTAPRAVDAGVRLAPCAALGAGQSFELVPLGTASGIGRRRSGAYGALARGVSGG